MTYLALVAVAVAVVLLLVLRGQLAATTIFEYERGLRFVRGNLRSELGPGLYRYLRTYTVIRKLDLRPVQVAVNGQEVLSRDGVVVKVSLSASYRVADPKTAVLGSENFVTALYTELQQALRAAVSGADVEALLANRAALGPSILDQCHPLAARLGLALEGVAIRDLTFPGDLKKIFSQVVKARQEGLAALEKARGETAALRHLANAAQMVERNPYLMQLRLLQVVGQQSGSTLVMGMPPGQTPIPLRDGAPDAGSLPPDVSGEEPPA